VSAPVGKRRKSRELAMQMLFQADVGKQSPEQVRKTFWEARDAVEPDIRGFAEDLYRVANVREEEIAELITKHAQNWRIERMPAVDRSVLKMAIAEILGFGATPAPIVINEALEIAKRYSGPESINFLNGVLDAVARSRREAWEPVNRLDRRRG
jgi:N utilization substance protein B